MHFIDSSKSSKSSELFPNSSSTAVGGATFTCVDKLDVGDRAVPVAVQAIDQVGDVLGTGLDPHFHETTFELPDRDAPTVVAVEFRKQF